MSLVRTQQDNIQGTEPISGETALIYGEVVTVKPIPSRQVTQIIIEIPEEHHIAATQLLFKRNAFIMPCADKSPLAGIAYGVTTLGDAMKPPPAPRPQPARQEINITQWLAIKGQDANFQTFMGADNEVDAADAVRAMCNVESRAEIQHDEAALAVFMEQIYKPFNAKFPTIRRFNPSGVNGGRS